MPFKNTFNKITTHKGYVLSLDYDVDLMSHHKCFSAKT